MKFLGSTPGIAQGGQQSLAGAEWSDRHWRSRCLYLVVMAEQYCGEWGSLHKPPLHELCKRGKGKRNTRANPEPGTSGNVPADTFSKPVIKPKPAEQPVTLSEEEELLLEEGVQALEKKRVADLLLRERWLEEELANLVGDVENQQSHGNQTGWPNE